ncbi:MAG TPA: DUF3333 domain-containing protein, partial [Sphingomicrobium sp.]|nr:DUF3333 domain-containing protein [Sphingomicrobium sp.]
MSSRPQTTASRWTDGSMDRRVARRYAAERRFRFLGFAAVAVSALFLAFLLVTMAWRGLGGFTATEAAVTIDFPRSDLMLDPTALQGPGAQQAVAGSNLEGTISAAAVQQFGPAAQELFSGGAVRSLADQLLADPSLLSRRETIWLPVASRIDVAAKGEGAAEHERMVDFLEARESIRRSFNASFLTSADATDPTAVGVWGALKGSFLTILVTMALAFPVGVLAAIYLEEFARRSRWTDAIEVSINNLAAVPSIIFGLLGLAVFLNLMHLPRSAPLVGGLTLALMTMPVIVIAGRNAIKSVPPSIRDAALGVGASKMQVVFHHVLP